MEEKEMKDRIEQEAMSVARVSNDSLDCRDCDYRYDDSIKLGNTSYCEQYEDGKPSKVLLGGDCEKKKKEI